MSLFYYELHLKVRVRMTKVGSMCGCTCSVSLLPQYTSHRHAVLLLIISVMMMVVVDEGESLITAINLVRGLID